MLPVFLPDGSVLPAFEPSAATIVRDGTLSVTVDEFERSHDSHQQADNTKHVLVSTQQFELPHHGLATFTIGQAATRLGPRRPDDLMLALAAFNVIDPERGLVFDILSNGIEVFAVHEQLSGVPKPAGPAYTYLIRHPFAPIELSPGVAHRCEIEFDMGAGTVRWLVNDTEIYRTVGAGDAGAGGSWPGSYERRAAARRAQCLAPGPGPQRFVVGAVGDDDRLTSATITAAVAAGRCRSLPVAAGIV